MGDGRPLRLDEGGAERVEPFGVDSVEQTPDLVEAEAELLERDQTVESSELLDGVVAVAGLLVDAIRPQQADLVVGPQHALGHPAGGGELSDGEHDSTDSRPSHSVRLKGSRRVLLDRGGSRSGRPPDSVSSLHPVGARRPASGA